MAKSAFDDAHFNDEAAAFAYVEIVFGQMAQFARIAAMLIRSAFEKCKARLPVLAFTTAMNAASHSP